MFKNILKIVHYRGLTAITFSYVKPFYSKYFYIWCNFMNMVPSTIILIKIKKESDKVGWKQSFEIQWIYITNL